VKVHKDTGDLYKNMDTVCRVEKRKNSDPTFYKSLARTALYWHEVTCKNCLRKRK
jgi:hypothetical protein